MGLADTVFAKSTPVAPTPSQAPPSPAAAALVVATESLEARRDALKARLRVVDIAWRDTAPGPTRDTLATAADDVKRDLATLELAIIRRDALAPANVARAFALPEAKAAYERARNEERAVLANL